jgi:serine/threonine protein kinase
MSDPRREPLSDADRQVLSARADEFYQAVTAGGDTADWDRFLAGLSPNLRRAVLHELVIIDLARRWERGDRPVVEEYVHRFPEIGPVGEVVPALILEEHRCRLRAGQKTDPDQFRNRFPDQFPEIEAELRGPHSIRPDESIRRSGSISKSGSVRTPAERGGSVGDRYERIRKLGEGAFAEVWEVVRRPSGIRKAMKILFQPADGRTVKRELQSLEVIKNLRHACLLATDDFWIEENRLHIVMELADATLRGRLEQCRAAGMPGVPRDELIGYLLDAAKGLDYLHHPDEGVARVIHRDVKPDNILILKGQAKVADFGLVRQQDESIAQQSIMAGTLLYMAPEIYAGEGGPASDQYGLAFAAVEVLQGRPPLPPAKTLHEMMMTVLDGQLDFDPEVSEQERDVFRKALARDPQHRYPSCLEFARELARTMGYHVPGTESRRTGTSETRRDAPRPPATPAAHPDHATLLPHSVETERSAQAAKLPVQAVEPPIPPTLTRPPIRQPMSVPASGKSSPNRFKLLLAGGVTLALVAVLGGVLYVLFGGKRDDTDQGRVEATNQGGGGGGDDTTKMVIPNNDDDKKGNGNKVVHQPPPDVVLPAGWKQGPDGKPMSFADGRKFYTQVLIPVGNETVPFRLIVQPGGGSFYMSESKITNAQYRGGSQSKQLKVGFGDVSGLAEAPAMNVTAEEAEKFASAVFGGHLPTFRQWDAAAGLDNPEGTGPTLPGGQPRIKLAAPAGGPGDDVAKSGVRDMAGNGREWTRNVLNQKMVGDDPLGPTDLVILRGRAFFLTRPLTYDILRKELEVPQTQFGQTRSPFTGFRVVMPLP